MNPRLRVIINVDPETGEVDSFPWTEKEKPPPLVRPRIESNDRGDRMGNSKGKIIGRFLNFIQQYDDSFSSWYIGVTSNVVRRLFIEHGVNEETGQWIYETAASAEEARDVERFFIERGMAGASGGGDEAAVVVYIYHKGPSTRP